MLFNILLGFIIPWIFGIFLYIQAPEIVLTVFPIGTVLAHAVNAIEEVFHFWSLNIDPNLEHVSIFIYDVGLYAILASYLIFIIHKKNIKPGLAILAFAGFTTLIEYIGVISGKIEYTNGWNMFFTFWSYLIPYILVYLYYKLLMNYNIIGSESK